MNEKTFDLIVEHLREIFEQDYIHFIEVTKEILSDDYNIGEKDVDNLHLTATELVDAVFAGGYIEQANKLREELAQAKVKIQALENKG